MDRVVIKRFCSIGKESTCHLDLWPNRFVCYALLWFRGLHCSFTEWNKSISSRQTAWHDMTDLCRLLLFPLNSFHIHYRASNFPVADAVKMSSHHLLISRVNTALDINTEQLKWTVLYKGLRLSQSCREKTKKGKVAFPVWPEKLKGRRVCAYIPRTRTGQITITFARPILNVSVK